MSDWIWVPIEAAYIVHDQQVARHGGVAGLRDRGLLEAAWAGPSQIYARIKLFKPEHAWPVAMQGDHGKPRPALVIQSDLFSETASVAILPITDTRIEAPLLRVESPADEETGLRVPSDVMVDKVLKIRRDRIGQVVGQAPEEITQAVSRNLAVFLGIA